MRASPALLVLFLLPLAACRDGGAPEPNGHDLLLFVVDTLRADHLSCYGYDRPTSPNVDALARRGARVADCTSQSSWTAPSMVSLFQARRVAADFVKMPAGPTLAERLKQAGYRTHAFQFNVLLDVGNGFERGFDDYLVEPTLEQILAILEAPADGPRFLYFHFVDPHDPYAPLAEFDRFTPRPVDPAQRRAFLDHVRRTRPELAPAAAAKLADAAAAHVAESVAKYDAEVLQADHSFGALLARLEASGRLDRTVVAFAADHGECLWQHEEAKLVLGPDPVPDPLKAFKMTHNSLVYEELIHVPLVFAGPGVPRGVVLDGPTENVDVVPTLLALLGLPAPAEVDGESLVPSMHAAERGERRRGRDLVFSHTGVFSSARLRSGEKLILPWDPDGPDAAMLFRLADDPHERTPLPVTGEVARGLEEAIAAYRRQALLPAAGEDEVDPVTAERMRQLGYLPGG